MSLIRPCVDKESAVKLARLLFGLRISEPSKVREFVSYDDRNFYLKGVLPNHPKKPDDREPNSNEGEYMLKILNHVDSENISYVNAQNEILLHLKARGFICPVPATSLTGDYTMECELKSSAESSGGKDNMKQQELPVRVYAVRLLSYVPGRLLKDVRCTDDLLFNLGRYIAQMNKALQVSLYL